MFDFVVKYLGCLKHVPLLPHVFESWLKINSLIFNKKVLDYIDDIESEVLSWKNTSLQIHPYGGIQFNFNKRELGHIHGNGLLDIRFSRRIKSGLIKERKAVPHHIFKNSGWVSFKIQTEEDKVSAIELLRNSYLLQSQRGF
ncbi:MAG TPA: luciferase family protein [Cyclobacteriaceae bacterium]|nr:luciferase family protein [Cyclobacteriaceae bacterium]